ncbi:hypothetical protein CCACVL1_23001 [Corchorus capsularis]|uniref:Uncharacterized protein n=1 Tax=Corchorus capsularis TaxID=210143 RepID=A0A1R3GVM9_COCAP|nr:hypothetical protein CCACVL1_23001 [Corchorus capsularis]
MCSKMSIQEEEKDKVIIADEWIDNPNGAEANIYLIGKLLLKKPVIAVGLLVVFKQFGDALERDRVFVSQPWLYHKALLVLREYDGEQQPENMVFESCPFWVNVHGVPFKMMNEKVGLGIGETMRNVLDIEPITGQILRIRVDMDLRLPFRRGTTLSAASGDVEIGLEYDKRPDYCWVCERVDHQETDRTESIAQIMEYGFSVRRFKPKDASPRSSAKMGTSSNQELMGSRAASKGRGTSQGEVNSKRVGRVALSRGSHAEGSGTERVGGKIVTTPLQKQQQSGGEGGEDNYLGLQQTRQGSSRPNTVEQLYGNIPGVGPSVMDLYFLSQADFGLVGKRHRASMMEIDVVSGIGSEDEFYKAMKNQAVASPFVMGSDTSGTSRQVRKFKKTAAVTSQGVKTNLCQGGRLCMVCANLGEQGLEKYRVDAGVGGTQSCGEDFISIGGDQAIAIARSSKLAAVALEAGREYDQETAGVDKGSHSCQGP